MHVMKGLFSLCLFFFLPFHINGKNGLRSSQEQSHQLDAFSREMKLFSLINE